MFSMLPFLIASPTTGLISLWSAFSLGVLHGFEPGHGKGIVSAYVAGKKPNVFEILGLCGILTLSHSVGAFSLVLLGLAFGGSLNQLNPAFIQSIHILAASFVVILGIHLLWQQRTLIKASFSSASTSENTVEHTHTHDAGDDEDASCCMPTPEMTSTRDRASIYKEIWLLGLSSGIKPCPMSLILVASSLQIGQWYGWTQGVFTILCFSLGMGVFLGSVGLTVLFVTRKIEGKANPVKQHPWYALIKQYLPLISATIILLSGLFFLWMAISNPAEATLKH
jgi:nickel/cobalt transporter (NicO) family protein